MYFFAFPLILDVRLVDGVVSSVGKKGLRGSRTLKEGRIAKKSQRLHNANVALFIQQ